MSDQSGQDKTFDINNIPGDAVVNSSESKEFAPLIEDTYQVEVNDVVLKENPFYHEPTEEEIKNKQFQSKYQFAFTFIILDEGEFRGRRIWDNTGLAFKPTTKQGKGGATKLYKIVARAMKTEFDWDACHSFAADTKVLYQNLLDNVKGQQIKVTIENNTNPETKKVRSKVVSYSNIKANLEKYDAEAEKAKRQAADTEANDALVAGASLEEALGIPVEEPKKSKSK